MIFPATEHKVETMTDNYVSIEHEHFGLPSEDEEHKGKRVRYRDTWYAVRPTPPQIDVVLPDGSSDPDVVVMTSVPWSIHQSGNLTIEITSRTDIDGLRKLLDALEAKMDQNDMAALMASVQDDLDNEDENE